MIIHEDAVLQFLQAAPPGVKYTAEEIGKAVRALVLKLTPEERAYPEGRLARNWASLRLNSLHRRGLIHKEGKKGRGASMKWWA